MGFPGRVESKTHSLHLISAYFTITTYNVPRIWKA